MSYGDTEQPAQTHNTYTTTISMIISRISLRKFVQTFTLIYHNMAALTQLFVVDPRVDIDKDMVAFPPSGPAKRIFFPKLYELHQHSVRWHKVDIFGERVNMLWQTEYQLEDGWYDARSFSETRPTVVMEQDTTNVPTEWVAPPPLPTAKSPDSIAADEDEDLWD